MNELDHDSVSLQTTNHGTERVAHRISCILPSTARGILSLGGNSIESQSCFQGWSPRMGFPKTLRRRGGEATIHCTDILRAQILRSIVILRRTSPFLLATRFGFSGAATLFRFCFWLGGFFLRLSSLRFRLRLRILRFPGGPAFACAADVALDKTKIKFSSIHVDVCDLDGYRVT